MISQTARSVAYKAASVAHNVAKNSINDSAIFKKSTGNSFGSFKEYRENAKTYGPLSASLASKRHLNHLH